MFLGFRRLRPASGTKHSVGWGSAPNSPPAVSTHIILSTNTSNVYPGLPAICCCCNCASQTWQYCYPGAERLLLHQPRGLGAHLQTVAHPCCRLADARHACINVTNAILDAFTDSLQRAHFCLQHTVHKHSRQQQRQGQTYTEYGAHCTAKLCAAGVWLVADLIVSTRDRTATLWTTLTAIIRISAGASCQEFPHPPAVPVCTFVARVCTTFISKHVQRLPGWLHLHYTPCLITLYRVSSSCALCCSSCSFPATSWPRAEISYSA